MDPSVVSSGYTYTSYSMLNQNTMINRTATACDQVSSVIDPDRTNLHGFDEHLAKSTSIVALVGAGLSAASGLPTFQGIDGLWRTYDPNALATPEAFRADPELVWQFYSHRRNCAMMARPNLAHHALAEFARERPGFLTLSQNIDGLSERAGHPEEQIMHLHGSLFKVQCVDSQACGYTRLDFDDPMSSVHAVPGSGKLCADEHARAETTESSQMQRDQENSAPTLSSSPSTKTSPTCPNCSKLLRPGVVWFGEPLPMDILARIRNWFDSCVKVDLMLVIGTSAQVYPAAGYINVARLKGARICVVNTDSGYESSGGLQENDWFFQGDASVILPTLLQPLNIP